MCDDKNIFSRTRFWTDVFAQYGKSLNWGKLAQRGEQNGLFLVFIYGKMSVSQNK